MSRPRLVILLVLAVYAVPAHSLAQSRRPQIAYVYPAGGKQGTSFVAFVGGQRLRGAESIHVSGDGVQAEVLEVCPPFRNIEKEQRAALAERMRDVARKRWQELVDRGVVKGDLPWRELGGMGFGREANRKSKTPEFEEVELPKHPLLYDLEHKSLRELVHAVYTMRNKGKGQRNQQLEETVVVRVTIDRDAEQGNHELRLVSRGGLSNPLTFQVGAIPETNELEGDEGRVAELLPPELPLKLPIVVNGQIMPGDTDRFRFQAKQGDSLVIEARARQLIPYLADAVPGWFQATLALRDAKGDELAFVDDFRFSPDPVLYYEVLADGVYELEIRDSIYRGREDFVYRLVVGEQPFVTSIFPLGCRVGQKRFVSAAGWNMFTDRLCLDAQEGDALGIHEKPLGTGKARSNPVAYEVDALRADEEAESNDTLETAQQVRAPRIVDGRIDTPGDVDYYQFEGAAGAELVAEIIARRVRSPLDSLLRLLDSKGNVLAWNDDCEHKEGYLHTDMGVLTHHSDSYLRTTLPADDVYYVQVSDVQSQGSADHAYRLRIGPPQPDFELRATPSSLNVHGGFAVPLRLYALRKDGYSGAIEVNLKDAPPGFELAGATIPARRDSIRATLSVPGRRFSAPVSITLEGRAMIDGQQVTRPVVPAEDMMQAFLYRHLTPVQEMLVVVQGGRRPGGTIHAVDADPLRLPAGGTGELRISVSAMAELSRLSLTLYEPPAGMVLQNVRKEKGALILEIATSGEDLSVGLKDNLVIEVAFKPDRGARERAANAQAFPLGVLPAVPFEIVSP